MLNKLSAIEEVLNKAVKERIFPGCSFAYISGGNTEVVNVGNFTYEKDSEKVDDNTIYDIASLTKVIAPMSIAMILIDEGKLDPNDLISKYLPEFSNTPEKEKAKIIHLLAYTLDYDVSGGSKSIVLEMSPQEIKKRVIEQPIKYSPGELYMYSNLTAFLLSQIIEKIVGKSLEDIFHQKISGPLDMKTSTFSPDKKLTPPTEITKERGEVRGFVHDEFSNRLQSDNILTGAAGIFSTAEDVGKFIKNILNKNKEDRIFSDKIISLWTKDHFPNLLPIHTPLCWGDFNNKFLDEYHREIVVKGGFTGCFMAIDLKNKKGFVLLSNRTYPKRPDNSSNFGKVKDYLMKVIFG